MSIICLVSQPVCPAAPCRQQAIPVCTAASQPLELPNPAQSQVCGNKYRIEMEAMWMTGWERLLKTIRERKGAEGHLEDAGRT